MLWTVWWVWLSAAILLGLIEILIPGFIFLGFAIGALAVALLILNIGALVGLPVLLLIFALLSLAAWLILRKVFAHPKGQVTYFEDDINE